MIRFRVEVYGVYRETWEVNAYDVGDAVRRIQWTEGAWLDAGWVGTPRYLAKPAKIAETETADAGARP